MRSNALLMAGLMLPALVQPACAQTARPPELNTVFQATEPYGEGAYTYYVLKVYDASLWTDAESWSMQAPFALSLKYAIDIEKADLTDKTIEQMNDIQPMSAEETASTRASLDRLYPAQLKEGDTLTALYTPDKDMRLYYNGELIGTTDNMAFARHFLDIWLSDRTTAPRLRRHLLSLPTK